MAGNRNRVRSEVAKGAEALRAVDIQHSGSSGTYPIGPFETDIDIKSVMVATGGTEVTAGSLTITKYNAAGTVYGTVVAITPLANTAYTSMTKTVAASASRLKSGEVGIVLINGSYSGGNSNIRIGYDVPVYDPNAKYTTYGSYDDGL